MRAAWVRRAPTLTRFAVDFVCLDFTFCGEKAARHLGYAPIYTREEAIRTLLGVARLLGSAEPSGLPVAGSGEPASPPEATRDPGEPPADGDAATPDEAASATGRPSRAGTEGRSAPGDDSALSFDYAAGYDEGYRMGRRVGRALGARERSSGDG